MGIIKRIVGAVKALFKKKEQKPRFQPRLLSTSTVEARQLPEYFALRAGLSKRDRDRPADVFAVKNKLGRAFFTRGLGQRMRSKRIRSLNRDELAIARAHGWVL